MKIHVICSVYLAVIVSGLLSRATTHDGDIDVSLNNAAKWTCHKREHQSLFH